MVRFYASPKGDQKTPLFDSPLQELNYLVDQLEHSIREARKLHVQALLTPPPPPSPPPPTESPSRSGGGGGIRNIFGRRSSPKARRPSKEDDSTLSPPGSPIHASQQQQQQQPISDDNNYIKQNEPKPSAQFVALLQTEPFVEQLRRVAELTVTGENYSTRIRKEELAQLQRAKNKWKHTRDFLDDSETQEDDEEEQHGKSATKDPKRNEYVQLFDLFFERNVLEWIIGLVTGTLFQLTAEEKEERIRIYNPDFSVMATSDAPQETQATEEEVQSVEADAEEAEQDDESHVSDDKGDETDQPTTDMEMADNEAIENKMDDGAQSTENDSDQVTDGNAADENDKSSGEMSGEAMETEPPENTTKHEAKAPRSNPLARITEFDDPLMLPPLEVAMQALQSVSILIQNVSRATSLFIILSNNRINELINMPLDAYALALSNELGEDVTESHPELAELTTHFVTFLKSLALRLDVQTLQFFLKYPDNHAVKGDFKDNEMEPNRKQCTYQSLKVEFPLYARALEFCSVHQDSFIRTTALNICLNTLRLASVAPLHENDEAEEFDVEMKSPSGVLHDTRPLPYRERLAIAHFTCIPSRVEQLVSPICTKLAERWASLDEQMREMDLHSHEVLPAPSDVNVVIGSNSAMEREQERAIREKLIRAFKECAADLQDDLHLLEDVFSVGLTVLNEQVIEILFATYVYPLLLQPLVLHSQRLKIVLEAAAARYTMDIHPLGGNAADFSGATSELCEVSGPAKTAMVSLAAMFYLVTNRPLLKLVFTALLHPLSPNTSALPTLRSTLEVETMREGKHVIRLDEHVVGPPRERSTYAFGNDRELGERRVRTDTVQLQNIEEGGEACVFVLSPALADVLEFTGEDNAASLEFSKANPYRRALLSFLDAPNAFADIRELAVSVLDAALTTMDAHFASEILFAKGGIVEGNNQDTQTDTTGSQATKEIVKGLCRNVVSAFKYVRSTNEWKLEYNEVAGHALLCACRTSPAALSVAAESLAFMQGQVNEYISSFSYNAFSPMGGSDIDMAGCPSINDPDYEDQMVGALMNLVYFESIDSADTPAVLGQLLQYSQKEEDDGMGEGYFLPVARQIDFDGLLSSTGAFIIKAIRDSIDSLTDREEIQLARDCIIVLLRVDALLNCVKSWASSGGLQRDRSYLAGFAVASEASVVELGGDLDVRRHVFSAISSPMDAILFPQLDESFTEEGSTINLDEIPFLACVCEVAATFSRLFSVGDAGVIDEGVRWQSLFLACVNEMLLIVHPQPGTVDVAHQGIVVSTCPLDGLTVRSDNMAPEGGSSARRLILSFAGYDTSPPLLFLFDSLPQYDKLGPFDVTKPFRSSLDVWFEDQNAANLALSLLTTATFRAKAERGRRITECLSNYSS